LARVASRAGSVSPSAQRRPPQPPPAAPKTSGVTEASSAAAAGGAGTASDRLAAFHAYVSKYSR
jgi:hypothetical protein